LEYVYGKNTVIELIRSGYEISEILLENSPAKKPFYKELLAKLRESKRETKVGYHTREKLSNLTGTSEHQGVLAAIEYFKKTSLQEFIKSVKDRKNIFIFVLDCIHDPHNMGAIIRSSYAMGVAGCVVFDKRSAKINSTVAKTSSGAVFHMNMIHSEGIFDAIAKLKEAGFTVLGCEMETANNIFDEKFSEGKFAVILGNEGEGLTGKSAAKIDRLIKIPMSVPFDSLNVSVTAGIIAYEYARQNHQK